MIKLSALKLTRKIFYLSLFLLACLFWHANLQTAYPVMKSGTITFSKINLSNQYNITHTTPFQSGQTAKCVHAIKGFEFQSSGLTLTSNQFNFRTQINSCENTLISLQCDFLDAHMIHLEASYFAIYNDQMATLVAFQIFDVPNGSFSSTGLWNINYVLDEDHIVPNGNIPGASKVQVYVCLQSLQISTNKTLQFQLLSAYVPTINRIQVSFFKEPGTQASFIKLQIFMFNIIRLDTEQSFHTFFWITKFSPNTLWSADTGVHNYDSSYFQTFVGLYGVNIDFTNMTVPINGSSQKYMFVDYKDPAKLSLQSNFLLNQNLFKGSQSQYWWFAFTKINTDDYWASGKKQLIIYIVAGIVSGVIAIIVCVFVYRKCFMRRRFTQRSQKTTQNQVTVDAVTMEDFKVEVWQKKY